MLAHRFTIPQMVELVRAGLATAERMVAGSRKFEVARERASLSEAGGLESYSLGYGVPVNRLGGRLNVGYNRDAAHIKYGAFAPLGLTSKSVSRTASLRQPLLVDDHSLLAASGGVTRRETLSLVSGVFLSRNETHDANLGVDYQSSDSRGRWLASYNVVNGEVDGAAGSEHYLLGRGSLMRIQQFDAGWYARASALFQQTGEVLLPSSEQFFIGGEGSVRGYSSAAFGGDKGASLSVELHHPIGRIATDGVTTDVEASGFLFLDGGYVTPFRPPATTLSRHETLTSIGYGVELAIGSRVSARVSYAYARRALPLEPRRYEVNFQLVGSVF